MFNTLYRIFKTINACVETVKSVVVIGNDALTRVTASFAIAMVVQMFLPGLTHMLACAVIFIAALTMMGGVRWSLVTKRDAGNQTCLYWSRDVSGKICTCVKKATMGIEIAFADEKHMQQRNCRLVVPCVLCERHGNRSQWTNAIVRKQWRDDHDDGATVVC